MEKKGFTLVELLAVIVVLAIILAIAIPGISGIIKSATKGAFASDAKMVITAINYQKIQNDAFDVTSINKDTVLSTLKLSNDNYESVTTTLVNNKVKIVIVGKNKWAGLTAYGYMTNMTVVDSSDYDVTPPVITLVGSSTITVEVGTTYTDAGATASDNKDGDITGDIAMTGTVNANVTGTYTLTYNVSDAMGNEAPTVTRTVTVLPPSYAGPKYISSKGVNGPVLATGMTPIKWDGNSWIDTDIYDSEWYNYTTTGKQWANVRTNDCTTPGNIETCSMWVWIPRYAYQITTGHHTAAPGTIDIRFLQGTANTTSDSTQIYEDSATNTHFVKHPAFNFGGVEMTGAWVAKFEHSGSTSALASKPGADSIRNVNIGNMFWASRNMETNDTYGWELASDLNTTSGDFATNTNNVDTHLIKNIEWGMVLYLAQSAYGKNSMITASASSKTGGGEGIAYVTNIDQSTTGTIYGIYDIAGGAAEYVMGNWDGVADASGFVTVSERMVLNGKYYKKYPMSHEYEASHYGDAIYETTSYASTGVANNSWYGGYSILVSNGFPWYVRESPGGYGFEGYGGYANANYGWRSVILVGEGL